MSDIGIPLKITSHTMMHTTNHTTNHTMIHTTTSDITAMNDDTTRSRSMQLRSMRMQQLYSVGRRAAVLACLLLGACSDASEGVSSASEGSTSSGDSDTNSTGETLGESATTTTGGPTTTTSGGPTTEGMESTTAMTSESSSTSGTSTTGATEGDTSSTGGPLCGDGAIDAGEECDLGAEMNGDGLFSTCSEECMIQPACNDGIYTPSIEECDSSDPLFVEAAVCSDACTWKGVIVFVTSATYSGDLGGLSGADARCQELAEEGGLVMSGQYHAWLSVGSDDAASRVPLVDEAYYRLDGEMIAKNSAQLLSGKLLHEFSITEMKAEIEPSRAWTNTAPDGSTESIDIDCQSFTSGEKADLSYAGFTSKTDAKWTDVGIASYCNKKFRLYCFSAAF